MEADAELVAGADVYAPADPEQPCGTVVQAAPAPNGGWDAIVSLQIAAAEQGGLHATAVDGTTLTLGTLPYLPGHLTPIWETLADRVRPAT